MLYMKKKYIFYSFIVLSSAFYVYHLYVLWNLYERLCVNKDFLTWDPELRFIITLKMMDHLRNGNIIAYLLQVFDSPHWPSLRNIVESIVFFITKPSPKATIVLTFIFYCILPLAILFVLVKEKIDPILQGSFYFLSILGLLQAESLQLYSFTGMLELQGAFFFIFASYYLSKVYQVELNDNTRLGWKLFIFTTLLHHSKYPYGYMLILCVVFIELFFFPKELYEYTINFLQKRKQGWYKNYRLWLVITCFLALLLPKHILTGKLPNYLLYGIVFFTCLDVFLFFYNEPTTSKNVRLHFLLKWFIFPILFWTLSQPDRLGSYSGQITHVEAQGFNPGQVISKDFDYYLLFINEFILNGFQTSGIAYLLLFGNILITGFGIYKFFKQRTFSTNFFLALLCILTFLELSLFTSNRLARHTYHLFPTLFLSIFLFLAEEWKNFSKLSWGLFVLVCSIICYPIVLNPWKFTSQVEVCYTGYDPKDYFTPRWIEEIAKQKMQKALIVINEVNSLNVNKADTEYLLTWLAYTRKLPIQFDPKRWKTVEPRWEELWIVGDSCQTPTYENKRDFWESFGFFKQNAYKFESELGCVWILPRFRN